MGKYLDSSGLTTLWSKVKNGLNLKLDKTGGTLTGPLTLSGAPSADLQAATKKYVDDSIPANLSDLTNDSGFITDSDITTKADKKVPATAGNFASLDASGNLIDSGHKDADYADASHTHTEAQIEGLASDLAQKANVTHTHVLSDVTDYSAPTLSSLGAAPAYTYGTTDLTAGTSELETGKLYFCYE